MKRFFQRCGEACRQKADYLRRRRHAIKAFAQTRDEKGVVRYYDAIAIPQTMTKELYDVRIKRYALGGSTTEVIEDVWTRARVLDYVHACA